MMGCTGTAGNSASVFTPTALKTSVKPVTLVEIVSILASMIGLDCSAVLKFAWASGLDCTTLSKMLAPNPIGLVSTLAILASAAKVLGDVTARSITVSRAAGLVESLSTMMLLSAGFA